MARNHKPEEIISKLREAEIVLAQGGTVADACRRIGVTEQSYYRWRKEYGGLKMDQARRMKELERENARLRRAVSDLTLDKLILQEAARGSRKTCKAQTSEPRAPQALHRSHQRDAGCIRAASLPRARAASIDAAQAAMRGRRRGCSDRGHYCAGSAVWSLRLSPGDGVAARFGVAREPKAG
jgi:putative transposase